MGKYDSTKTRVTPVFDSLLGRDPTGLSWLQQLLSLPKRATGESSSFSDRLRNLGALEASSWGADERSLPAPRSLLHWLLTNASSPSSSYWQKTSSSVEKRKQLLVDRDPKLVIEAIKKLEKTKLPAKKWFVLEGATRPDVFLQTAEVLIVIEGKRTEPGPTTKTTWMKRRSQMLRHMDCASEIAGTRTVLGFFIVESDDDNDRGIPKVWQDAATDTVTKEMLEASLPHRNEDFIEKLANGFLGVTTWQEVCEEFGIVFPEN